jgi:hypothetical protein
VVTRPLADVHVHSVSGDADAADAAAGIDALVDEGLTELFALLAPNFGWPPDAMRHFFPPESAELAARSAEVELPFGLAVRERLRDPSVMKVFLSFHPFLPHLMGGAPVDDAVAEIDRWQPDGLKLHYFDEPHDFLSVYRSADGRWHPARQHELVRRLFGEARRRDLPVVVHVDLRRSWDGIAAVVEEFDDVATCICHLGYSRTRCADFLDRYPWLVTDLSGIGLHEHLLQQPDQYRSWILERPQRVLFGSDRYLGAVPDMRRSWDILDVLALGEDVDAAVRHGNASRFTPRLVPPR